MGLLKKQTQHHLKAITILYIHIRRASAIFKPDPRSYSAVYTYRCFARFARSQSQHRAAWYGVCSYYCMALAAYAVVYALRVCALIVVCMYVVTLASSNGGRLATLGTAMFVPHMSVCAYAHGLLAVRTYMLKNTRLWRHVS